MPRRPDIDAAIEHIGRYAGRDEWTARRREHLATMLGLSLALMTSGLDFISAFSAIVACMNNMGPGLGAVASHFRDMSDFAVWVCSFAMVLGRLEVFTLLVLLTPQFWRD